MVHAQQLSPHPILLIVLFEVFLVALFSVPQHQHRNKIVLFLLVTVAAGSIWAAPLTKSPEYAQLWSFAWVPWLATFAKFVATSSSPEKKYWRRTNGIGEAESLGPLNLRKIG